MSRAFTKEPDGSEPIEVTERPISADRNFVTESGLKQIEQQIENLKKQQELEKDEMALAQLARDLRYWQARRATAELVVPAKKAGRVMFGSKVTIEGENGFKIYRLVGQDEADAAKGLLSYTSPLATQLIGKQIGDEIKIAGKTAEITAIDI